jgi:hypothetical protein
MNGGTIAAIVIVLMLVLAGAGVGIWYAVSQNTNAGTSGTGSSGTGSSGTGSSGTGSSGTGSSGTGGTGSNTTPPTYRDYTFYQGDDSSGNDIEQDSADAGNSDALKGHCDNLTGCVGFNTNGFMKNKIYDAAYRAKWTTDPDKGLYVLKSYSPVALESNGSGSGSGSVVRTYTFYQGADSGDYDIAQDAANANNIPALKAKCDSLTGCVGFNTNGYMKNKIFSAHSTWTTDPAKGLYVVSGYKQA